VERRAIAFEAMSRLAMQQIGKTHLGHDAFTAPRYNYYALVRYQNFEIVGSAA
jgi:hypothetical protein